MAYRHIDTYNGIKTLGILKSSIGLERGGGGLSIIQNKYSKALSTSNLLLSNSTAQPDVNLGIHVPCRYSKNYLFSILH